MEHKHSSDVAVQVDRSVMILDGLKVAYGMELETVCSYLANSVNLDGVRAREIKRLLAEDLTDELGHAQKLARRIHILGGSVPGSQALRFDQNSLQPKDDSGDLLSVIRGVIDAEEGACRQYQKVMDLCEGHDLVTQELCIELLADEEEHRREFQGFLKEFGIK